MDRFPTENSGEEIYSEHNESCPICGGEIEATGHFDSEGAKGWQDIQCNDCSSTWSERWHYIGRREEPGDLAVDDGHNESCPYCRSSQVEGQGFDSEGHHGEEVVRCLACGHEWTEEWEYSSTLIRTRNQYMPFNIGDEVRLSDEVLEDGNYGDVIGTSAMIITGCGIGSSESGGTGGLGYDDGLYPEPLYDLAWPGGGEVPVSLYGYELELA